MNFQADVKKTFHIRTLGCKVNQYESQAMREILLGAGFNECRAEENPCIYILNTCTVTERADRECRRWINAFHKTNPQAKIAVTGCYVERDASCVLSLPGVEYIVRNREKNRIAGILDPRMANPGQRIPLCESRTSAGDSYPPLAISEFKGRTKAFVKIQDGCANRCSYCKVPLVRGPSKSRPLDDIVAETKALVGGGYKEIVLTGICLGAWSRYSLRSGITGNRPHGKALGLGDVLKALGKIRGDFRIRLSSIEPKYVAEAVIDFIAGNKRMCRHLHIPLQSGDDKILRMMNRPYTRKSYGLLVEKIRSRVKDIAIATDILIGFPGESDRCFRNTLDFVKDILPARTHIFTYSPRMGTAAYAMKGAPAADVVKKRYDAMRSAALDASYSFRRKFLGRKLDVLVENERDKSSGSLAGYSDNYIKVCFEGADTLMNRIVPVTICNLDLNRTEGKTTLRNE